MKKRLLALLLAMVMLVSMLPVQAFAADEEASETPETTVATEATVVPEATEEAVPETTEEVVPETTVEAVPETTEETTEETEETVPEETEETVPETTEETVPEETQETVPEETQETVPAEEAAVGVAQIIVLDDGMVQGEYALEKSLRVGDPFQLKAKLTEDSGINEGLKWVIGMPQDEEKRAISVDPATGNITYKDGFEFTDELSLTGAFHEVIATQIVEDDQRPAYADNGVWVTVYPALSGIALTADAESPYNVFGKTGETITISAGVGDDGPFSGVTWSVADKSKCVTYDKADKELTLHVTGKTGTVTITAVSKDNAKIKNTMTLQFVNTPTDVKINNLPNNEKFGGNLLRGGSKVTLTTNLTGQKGLTDSELVWELVSQWEGEPTDLYDPIAKIDPKKGVLTTYPVAERQYIYVKATLKSTYGSENPVSDRMEITLTPATELVAMGWDWHDEWENTSGEAPGGEAANTRTDFKYNNGWMFTSEWLVLTPTSYPEGAIQAGNFQISGKALDFARDKNGNILYGENGSVTVKPVRPGKATVTYTAADGTGCKYSCGFTVYAPAGYWDIQPEKTPEGPLTPGDTLKLNATAYVYAEVNEETGAYQNFKYPTTGKKVNWGVYEVLDENWNAYPGASINSKGELKITKVTKPTTLRVVVESQDTYKDGYGDSCPVYGYGEYAVEVAPAQEKTLALVWGYYSEDGELSQYEEGEVNSCGTDVGNSLEIVPAWYNAATGEYDALSETELASVSYRSSKPKVAVYDKTEDLVKILGAGTATITASCGGQTASLQISAVYPVTEVEVTGAKTVVGGKSITLKATAWTNKNTQKATNQRIYWTVTDDPNNISDRDWEVFESDYASINSKGKLTTKNVDTKVTVYVVATSDQGRWDDSLHKFVPIQDVFPVTITPKQTVRTDIIYTNYGAFDTTEYFPVNVDRSPVYSKAEAALRVYDSAFHTEENDGCYSISGDDVTWTSSKAKVAFIATEAGTIKNAAGAEEPYAKGDLVFTGAAGTTVVTAKGTAANGQTYTAKVTIKAVKAVTSVTVEPKVKDQYFLYPGKTVALKAVTNADAANKKVRWIIKDGRVASTTNYESSSYYATISSSGVVKASKNILDVKDVTVFAIATDMGGYSVASEPFHLTIYPKTSVLNAVQLVNEPQPIEDESTQAQQTGEAANQVRAGDCLDRRTIEIPVGYYNVFGTIAQSVFGEGTAADVKWTSSNSKVVSVANTILIQTAEIKQGRYAVPTRLAVLTTMKPGTATIKATAQDGSGKSVTFTIKVVENS